MEGFQVSTVLMKIHGHEKVFTSSEKKVADVIERHPAQVVYLSVVELAEKADVGETTVLRFCRKLGFKGYQEFKLALAKDNIVEAEEERVAPDSGMEGTVKKVTDAHLGAIRETVSLVDPRKLEKAVEMIRTSDHIQFCGVGTSGITAMDAWSKFMRIGLKSSAITDTHFQLMTAATLSKNDLLIGFTVSGSSVDTVKSMEMARKNGAKTIAVTQFARSPITQFADLVILTSGREGPLEGGSLTTKMAQLVVVDLLCTGASLQDEEYSRRYKEKTAEAVVDKIY